MMLTYWKKWAHTLGTEVYALYLAQRDPRVPWYARCMAACVVAYAFSPIDLIPDPIPILGYLDDLIMVPLGIWLTLKMIPERIMAEYREKARSEIQGGKPTNWLAAGIIVLLWVILVIAAFLFAMRVFKRW